MASFYTIMRCWFTKSVMTLLKHDDTTEAWWDQHTFLFLRHPWLRMWSKSNLFLSLAQPLGIVCQLWETEIIGAGLHCGSVFTRKCLLVAIHRKFEMSAFKYFTKIEDRSRRESYTKHELPEWSVGDPERRQLKARVTTFWGLCFCRPSTAGRLQAVEICTVVEVA